MSISTNIDGSVGSANQLFDLLTVVSNPVVYQEKIRALEEATAKHKKYVDLVGPASEVLALRDKAREAVVKAEEVLKAANIEANSITVSAQKQASNIVSEAKQKATTLFEEAEAAKSYADAAKLDAAKMLETAKLAQSKADAAMVSVSTQAKELDVAIMEAKQKAQELAALKAELVAKHKAFIESL